MTIVRMKYCQTSSRLILKSLLDNPQIDSFVVNGERSLLFLLCVLFGHLLLQYLLIATTRSEPFGIDIVKVHIGAAISFSSSFAILYCVSHAQGSPNILVMVLNIEILIPR